MDFKDLQYIIAIAKYQNITKAAESLYIGQPALTKFLQKTEKELGLRLFNKLGNRFTPTYAGECYLTSAQKILCIHKDLNSQLQNIQKLNIDTIKIGFPLIRGDIILPVTIPLFQEIYPNITIEISEHSSEVLEDMLIRGDIDIAFINILSYNPVLNYEIICEEEMLLVLPENHFLIKNQKNCPGSNYPFIDLQLFKDEKFITLSTANVIKQIFQEFHINPKILLSTKHLSAMLHMVSQHCGVGLVFDVLLDKVKKNYKIELFSFGGVHSHFKFAVAYRKNYSLTPYAKNFIQIVKNNSHMK